MKSTISLYFAALLAVSTIVGCKSSTDSNTSSSGVSASIAGSQWSATTSAATHTSFGGVMETTSIAGSTGTSQSDMKSIQIGLSGAPKAGTYNVGMGGATAGYTTPNKIYNGVSGSVVVTSWTTGHITGTFSFKGMTSSYDTISVSNGSFDLDIKSM